MSKFIRDQFLKGLTPEEEAAYEKKFDDLEKQRTEVADALAQLAEKERAKTSGSQQNKPVPMDGETRWRFDELVNEASIAYFNLPRARSLSAEREELRYVAKQARSLGRRLTSIIRSYDAREIGDLVVRRDGLVATATYCEERAKGLAPRPGGVRNQGEMALVVYFLGKAWELATKKKPAAGSEHEGPFTRFARTFHEGIEPDPNNERDALGKTIADILKDIR